MYIMAALTDMETRRLLQPLRPAACVSTIISTSCRWSLDLGVSTDIVGLVIAAQTAVGDLKIAIGDNESPLTNAECSVGVQIEANATSAQVCYIGNQHV